MQDEKKLLAVPLMLSLKIPVSVFNKIIKFLIVLLRVDQI